MRKLLIGALLCPFFSHCTPRNNQPPFSVGDAFPPFTISNITNSPSPTLFIPSVGNKVYVLNFVAVGCSACVRDYPRLSALQQRYGKDLQIILITAESSERVQRFLKQTRFGQDLNLPVAASDTLLASWFPHRYLSHTVWLQGGKVKGITSSEYINEANVEIIRMNRSPGWPVKKDDANPNLTGTLLAASSALPPFAPTYSMFAAHMPGFTPLVRQTKDSATASVKTTILNKTIVEAYRYAYGLPANFPVSGITLAVRDTSRYVYTEGNGYKLDWDYDHTFCYESVLPATLSPEQTKQKLVADLDFYWGLVSRFQRERVKGFALTTTTQEAKPLLTTGVSPQFISLSNLVYHLNHHWYGTPVTNETGITEKRYIPFDAKALANPKTAQAYLAAYGLALKPVEKEEDCLSLVETAFGTHN